MTDRLLEQWHRYNLLASKELAQLIAGWGVMSNQHNIIDGVSVAEGTQQDIQQLIKQACQHPLGSLERRRGLTRLIIAIQASRKLWREQTPYYEEALQQTWIYLRRNLCEACTGRQYDPTRAAVTTWLDAYLKRRLQDFRIQENEDRSRRFDLSNMGGQGQTNPIEEIASPSAIPPILEETLQWIEADPTGELATVCVQGHPDLTCQQLLRHRLPPVETSWKELAREFNSSISTLANFYQRQCLPRLRKFGESQGYL